MTVPAVILRFASALVPSHERRQWMEDWRAELWHIPPTRRTSVALAAFPDALWLRRHNTRSLLDAPLACLAVYALAAALATGLTLLLPPPHTIGKTLRYRPEDLPIGWAAMLMLTVLLLPATRIAIGRGPAGTGNTNFRRAAFFVSKVALVQPVLLLGFIVMIWAVPILPIAPHLAACGSWFLTFRWVLLDQRRRCPVCLHLLTTPVRIGTPASTFLAWYGAEATCARGHGLLHISDNSTGLSRWLRLDESWRGLFS